MIEPKYIWTRTLPVLAFVPGSHGNFISRCLSVASGVQPDFNFYKNTVGAHAEANFKKVVISTHSPEWVGHKDIFCLVDFDDDDMFILTWHAHFAASDTGFDILKVKDFNDVQKFIDKDKDAHGIKYLMDHYNGDGIPGLRELFKKRLIIDSPLITRLDHIKKDYTIHNKFQFSWCYDKKMFCKQIENLCTKLGYDYKVDITHHIEEFIEKKQNIIEAHALVNRAFQFYKNKKDMNISTLSLYEQAYLDCLIEKDLGYEIELWKEYPTNTINLKPIQAWDDKRYDI